MSEFSTLACGPPVAASSRAAPNAALLTRSDSWPAPVFRTEADIAECRRTVGALRPRRPGAPAPRSPAGLTEGCPDEAARLRWGSARMSEVPQPSFASRSDAESRPPWPPSWVLSDCHCDTSPIFALSSESLASIELSRASSVFLLCESG